MEYDIAVVGGGVVGLPRVYGHALDSRILMSQPRDRAWPERSRYTHDMQTHHRNISTFVSRHFRRAKSWAPTLNQPSGFW